MDKQKLNLMVSVVCMFLFITMIVIEKNKFEEIKAMRLIFNETDYSCCAIYRNPIMPFMCQYHPYNATAYRYPQPLPAGVNESLNY